jgi:hypothetical protein
LLIICINIKKTQWCTWMISIKRSNNNDTVSTILQHMEKTRYCVHANRNKLFPIWTYVPIDAANAVWRIKVILMSWNTCTNEKYQQEHWETEIECNCRTYTHTSTFLEILCQTITFWKVSDEWGLSEFYSLHSVVSALFYVIELVPNQIMSHKKVRRRNIIQFLSISMPRRIQNQFDKIFYYLIRISTISGKYIYKLYWVFQSCWHFQNRHLQTEWKYKILWGPWR